MNDIQKYKYHNRRNGLKWIMQGSIDKHFFKPHGKEYHYRGKKIDGRVIMDAAQAHKAIADHIKGDSPFWMARYGQTEMRFINSVLYRRYINGRVTPENADVDSSLWQLCNNAGFFPYDKRLGEKYVDTVLNAAVNIDIHAKWDLWMEEYMISVHEKDAEIMNWGDFAPYYLRQEDGITPWTHALKNKRVLVINPFVESIKKQYESNRERLFESIFDSNDILPSFELITLKSIQTAGGTTDVRFKDWFEALEYMKMEIDSIDFDVALIGCGAYGFLLADHIKRIGKGAIQSCGCTQMLFGVLGKRWMSDSVLMSEVVNKHWVRPSQEERYEGIENVENACYW